MVWYSRGEGAAMAARAALVGGAWQGAYPEGSRVPTVPIKGLFLKGI